MKTFEYSRVQTVAEALREGAAERTVFLGGGTNLIDLMRYGVESPDSVVDVTRLSLYRIEDVGQGGLRIGALVKNSDLAADKRIKQRFPVLTQAILNGASPQIRNMATTGGNLLQRTRCSYFYDTAFPCNKRDPGSGCPAIPGYNRMHAIIGGSDKCIAVHPSDMAVALRALDASVQVEGPRGKRVIPIADFHRLPGDNPERDSTLERGELITSIELPKLPIAQHSTYVKVRDRASFAFALVSVAAVLHVDRGVIREARFALGGVAPKPWRSEKAETSLVGKAPSRGVFRDASEIALAGAQGYGHNDFKIELAKRTIVRAFDLLAGGSA